MAVIIPNTTDTTGGEEFAALDQAEPDSLDFEIVGATGVNGVLSGGTVTSNGNNTNVAVAAGTVVVGGASYSFNAEPSLGLPPPPTEKRFDLVVYRVGTGLTVVKALNESDINPVFPQSMNVFGGAFVANSNIDFSTDVVLAACYRDSSSAVNAPHIVDKRAMVSSTVMWQGSSLPATADNGTLFFLKTEVVTGTGVTVSGLYVRAGGQWLPMAQSNSSIGVPIGATIYHNSPTPPPGYLVENGTAVSRSAYSKLFDVIGTSFGIGDGTTTFNLPNTLNKFIRGATTATASGGVDSYTLTAAQMRSHTHTLNDHSHTMGHTHSIDHGHSSSNTSPNGSHDHSITHTHSEAVTSTNYHVHGSGLNIYFNEMLRRLDTAATGTGINRLLFDNNQSNGVMYTKLFPTFPEQTGGSDHGHTVDVPKFSGPSVPNGSHAHSVSINSHSGSSKGSSKGTTGKNNGNTGPYGGSGAIDNKPAYVGKVPCIRAL